MTRYRITPFETRDGTAYRLEDTLRRAEAVVYPAYGANCAEFRTTPDPDGRMESDAEGDPVDVFLPPDRAEDLREGPFNGGLPILFPFPNRVRDGAYAFAGRAHKLQSLLAKRRDREAGHAIHGLVADKPWTVESAEADEDGARVRAALQLDAFPDLFEQYPYRCRLSVLYTLCDGALQMHSEARNTGADALPMGFGIHPYFPTALRPGVRMPAGFADIAPERRARAEARVPADAIWELDRLMPTGTVLPVESDLARLDLRAFRPLGGLAFDHVFTRLRRRSDGWSEGGLRDPETGLEMVLTADPAFREWVFYAPLTRPVVSFEPYTCATDAVNLQPQGYDAGLIALSAGQTWTGEVRFALRWSDA